MIGVPKTIDNDLDKTTATFGFDTAVGFATECIDRLFSTATSHGRVIVVEVMGRYAGWIALHSGMAAGAHCILIPEIPYSLDADRRHDHATRGSAARSSRSSWSPKAAVPVDGEVSTIGKAIGQAVQLGGVGGKVAAELELLTGKEARTVVLGHLLRGGSPDVGRPAARPPLRRRRGAGARGGPQRGDGRARPAATSPTCRSTRRRTG